MYQARQAIELGKLTLALGRVNRATFHEDGRRRETDTDHTVMLGIIACAHCPDHLDRGLVAEYALVHDLVEAKVGDTNSFDISVEAKIAKDIREAKALEQLCREFIDVLWLVQRIDEYETQVEPEARFIRFLDKAMPKITHALNGCVTYKAMGKTKEDIVLAHGEQLADLISLYPEFVGTPTIGLMIDLMAMSVDAYDQTSTALRGV